MHPPSLPLLQPVTAPQSFRPAFLVLTMTSIPQSQVNRITRRRDCVGHRSTIALVQEARTVTDTHIHFPFCVYVKGEAYNLTVEVDEEGVIALRAEDLRPLQIVNSSTLTRWVSHSSRRFASLMRFSIRLVATCSTSEHE